MHQILFYINDFPIRSYGVVLSLSILLSIGMAYFFAKKDGEGYEKHIVDMGLYAGLSGIIGARLWDVFFFDFHYYRYHLDEIFHVWQGGMAIQGGIVFGFLAGYLYCKYHKLDILKMMDIVAPAIIFGQGLGRCANLLNGDAFGTPTGSNFGIIYPSSTLAYKTYGEVPLCPSEIWEGQMDFVIFGILLIYLAFNRWKGSAFAIYLFLYSLARFMLEFLRGDYTTEVIFSLTSAQVTSVIGMILGIVLLIYCYLRRDGEIKAQSVKPQKLNKKTKKR